MKRYSLLLCIALAVTLIIQIPVLAFENFDPYSGPEFQKDPTRYYIVIDTSNQVAIAYEKDDDGKYTRALRYMPVTSGMPGNSTPRGTFKMPGMRERFGYFIEYNVYAQYHTQIVRGVYVHSFLFNKRDEKTPQIGTYNRLGNTGSHGCVRMRVEDARWIYYNCPKGTTVSIVGAPKNPSLKAKANKVPWKDYNPGVDPNPVPAPVFGRVLVDSYLRAGPGLGSSSVAKVSAGDEIELLQFSDIWIKVRIPSDSARKKEGFMQRDFVAFLPETQMPEYTRINLTRMITSPIYEAPSLKSKIIGRVEYLTKVQVTETQDKFHHVKIKDFDGWMLKSHISTYTVAKR